MRVMIALLLLVVAGVSQGQTVSYFRKDGVMWDIAAGPDGNLWVPIAGGVVKMTPAGLMTQYTWDESRTSGGRSMITAGPDGRMWFTVPGASTIVAVTMSGAFTEYAVPEGTRPVGITSGPDGNIWFGYAGGVGRITTTGDVTLFAFDSPTAQVLDLVTGPDGNLWFVEYPQNRIGRITPAGVVTHFETYPAICCGPASIEAGNDGALWFALNQGQWLGRITTDGTVTRHDTANVRPTVVAKGPGATIWFGTEVAGLGSRASIGRIDADGEAHIAAAVRYTPMVMGLTAGTDGNMWATLYASGEGCTLGCPPPPAEEALSIARLNLTAAAHHAPVPMLGEVMLALLAALLGGIAMLRMR